MEKQLPLIPGSRRDQAAPTTPTAAKRDALLRVERNADAIWMRLAALAVQRVAHRCEFFTTDEVWAELEQDEHRVTPPHEPRAMGAVMMRAVRDKVCVPTAGYRQSTRAVNHSRPIRVWRRFLTAVDRPDV